MKKFSSVASTVASQGALSRTLASKPGSRPKFPALDPDLAVELKEDTNEGGMFGIGMKIDLKPPHRVMRVSNLKDPAGNSANDSVKIGDALAAVDGNAAKVANMQSIEKLIFGKKDTIITLTFLSEQTGQKYDVALKRHIPIQTWDSELQWYEVKEEHRGSNLMALPEIVKSMDEIRRLLIDKHGFHADLLRRDKDLRQGTAVGIVLPQPGAASTYEPNQIADMIRGSPAHLSGELQKGDTILYVDGTEVNERNITDRLHGCDVVGSPCKIILKRNGSQQTVQIVRASHSAVERIQEVLDFVSAAKNRIKENASPETVQRALDEVAAKLLQNEKERQAEEEVMAYKIHALQAKILEHLSLSMARLYPSKEKDNKELSDLADNLSAQLAKLQDELAEAYRRRDELSRQVTDLSKENSDAADTLVSKSKLLEDLERQRAMTVQKSELNAALESAKRAETDLLLLQQQLSGMVEKGELETANHTISSLEAQLAKLKERLEERVPRSELEDKLKEIRTLQTEIERLKSAAAKMVPLSQLQALQEELAGAKAELERGESAKGRMVSSDELTDANEAIGRLQAELERLKAEMKRMVPSADLERVQQQLNRAKTEAAKQRALMEGMVPGNHAEEASAEIEALKAALEKARRDGADRVAKSELESTNQRMEKLAEELRKTKALLREREQDVEELKRAMAGMVARSELLEAQAAAKQAQSELASVREELKAMEEAKAQWKAKAEGYKAQAEELDGRMAEMIDKSEYYQALADAKRGKDGMDSQKSEVKSLSEKLQALRDEVKMLKAELDKCKTQLAGMVPRSELNAALAEVRKAKEDAEARKKEAELLSSQLADVKAKLKTAKEEAEKRQSQLSDMVPRAELLKARAEAKSKDAEIESKQSQISDWKKANGALEEQVKALKEEMQQLERALKGKIDQNELLAAQKETATLRDQLAKKSQELLEQEAKMSVSKKLLARAEEEIAELKKKLGGLVERNDYLDEKSKAAAAREEADAKDKEVKMLQEQLRAIKSELIAAKGERDALQLRLGDMVPRSELADAQRDLLLLRNKVFALEKEAAALKEERDALKAQLSKAKVELDKLSAQMSKMADKDALAAAKAEAKQASDGIASIQKQLNLSEEEKAEKSKQLRELKEKFDKLEQLLLDSVPRKDYLAAQEEAKRAKDELVLTRTDNEAMEKTIEKLRAEAAANTKLLEELRNQMADMVPREAFLKAQAEAKDKRHEAERLSAELEQLKSELALLRNKLEKAATKADFDAAQAAARRAQDELEALRRKLAAAGLAEQALLDRLLAALKGPPPLDPARVARLLEVIRGSSAVNLEETLQMVEKMAAEDALLRPMDVVFLMGIMQGPPRRTMQDLRRLLAALGSMSTDDLVRLLQLFRGPPPLSVSDLEAMLRLCPSLADLEKLKAELAALRLKVAEQAKALQEQAAALEATSAKVCPAPSEHEEMRRVRAAPPVLHEEGGTFFDSTTLHISPAAPLCTLFVTTDGSDPSPSNFARKGPVIELELDESCQVRAVASHDGREISAEASAEYTKKEKKKAPPPAPAPVARAAPPPPPAPPKAAGVGLLIERFDGSRDVTVKQVIGSGPAAACGLILAGDQLLSVGGLSVAGMDMPQIYGAIEGNAGTVVELMLQHRGGATHYSVSLVREFADVDSLNEKLAAEEAARKTPPGPPPVASQPPKAAGSKSLFPDKPPDGSVFLNMLNHKSYAKGANGN